ncbi:MAG: AmmeMemoRadiSam system radical SAM enzyme [Endomicrobiales bacterium]|nr:AmmeMemoRadiSam system radical SAM enzyme [Endomicrobiales bacterium]
MSTKKKITISFTILFLFSVSAALSKEAKYYEKLPSGEVQCLLCPRECLIKEGQVGNCRVRKNVNGVLESIVYAKPCSVNLDPIEKKPLFHFLPGTPSLSIATVGCNLRCVFCQNWSISQVEPDDVRYTKLFPEDIVKIAKDKGAPSISYTYSEPTSFFEYMYDCSLLARKNGIKNVWITCGYINQDPLKELCTVLDAANVDIKGFYNKTYRWIAGAKIDPILETLKTLKEKGVWLEVGYLVIPTVNDSDEEIDAMLEWFIQNLGPDVPLHFLRFFPQHKLTNLPPTPITTLEKIYEKAKKSGINYVYIGNVPGHKANHTYCPKCKKMIIERKGYFLKQFNIKNGRCKYCGQKISGVWE